MFSLVDFHFLLEFFLSFLPPCLSTRHQSWLVILRKVLSIRLDYRPATVRDHQLKSIETFDMLLVTYDRRTRTRIAPSVSVAVNMLAHRNDDLLFIYKVQLIGRVRAREREREEGKIVALRLMHVNLGKVPATVQSHKPTIVVHIIVWSKANGWSWNPNKRMINGSCF